MKGVICHGKLRRTSKNKPLSEVTLRLPQKLKTKSTFYRHLESVYHLPSPSSIVPIGQQTKFQVQLAGAKEINMDSVLKICGCVF